jgi:PAS domain S-box-containing protein
MVTAYASLETAVSALIQGASAYLIKPLNIDEVLLTVSDAIEKQQLALDNKRLYLEARRELAERKKAEDLFRTVSLMSPAGMYIVQDGKFVYANPQFLRDVGYSEAELLGMETHELVYQEDRERVRQHAIEMLRGFRTTPYEYRGVNHTGYIRWMMETVASIQHQGKRAALGNVLDITSYKQLERKMMEYKELDKLKSGLLSTVSHELRTPLAVIKGYATMLLDYNRNLHEEEKLQNLGSIDRATDRLTELVDHLLDMSRLEAGLLRLEKQPTDIAGLIEEAVTEARLAVPGGRVISRVASLPQVSIDARRIRQVLDNLIDNAVKYSNNGSEVTVEVVNSGTELEVCVIDHGIGISPEDQELVFDRMYRAEQRLTQGSRGLGLGLAVCKGVVEAHGGRIWVDSRLGEGSIFRFVLPLTD